MYENWIKFRNKIEDFSYRFLFKPIFFSIDPEVMHDSAMRVGGLFSNKIGKRITSLFFNYKNKMLSQTVDGVFYPNPIGVAAGFDKSGELAGLMEDVGFGYEEVGSVTLDPCGGNAKPRLWRLKKSKSLLVYYGLKNDGCVAVKKRLQIKQKNKLIKNPIGISIAKTNCKETADPVIGLKHYIDCFDYFTDFGDYITINISCPNSYGGEAFTDPALLDKLLGEIDKRNDKRPLYLKISPDLTYAQIDELTSICDKHNVSGFIASNLTKKRENKKIIDKVPVTHGGLSGRVVDDLANDHIKYIYNKTKSKYTIIGCGGIFTAEDAYKKIKSGASLLQLITSMIFCGPQTISQINQGLVELLKKDGYTHISEAIGIEAHHKTNQMQLKK